MAVMPVFELAAPGTSISREYDPRAIDPNFFAALSEDGCQWRLIGGRTDYAAGIAVRGDLEVGRAASARRALVRHAVGLARTERRHAVALYVAGMEIAAFRAAMGPDSVAPTRPTAMLKVVGTSIEDHVRRLDATQRRHVRADLRRRERFGLSTRVVDAETMIDQAAGIVASVRRRHGHPDHPRLVAYRLRAWSRSGAGRAVAVVVDDRHGATLAVGFCYDDGTLLEHYEIGLVDSAGARYAAYLEALIYGPLTYAQRTGISAVELGLGSEDTKRLRGADLSPVWLARDTLPG
jgi:hypothetical protein